MIVVQHHVSHGSVTASRMVEAVVVINVMAVDWLANFSATTKLQQNCEKVTVVKSASEIRIRRFYDNLTTS